MTPTTKTSHRYIVADVVAGLKSLPDHSVDLVFSSPPFLALRSYLPTDSPQKHLEIGSEATPADFIDTMLDVVEECRRVLAPHGSLVFELGDTYSRSGGAGGDYGEGGLRDEQNAFDGAAKRSRTRTDGGRYAGGYSGGTKGHDVSGSNGGFDERPIRQSSGWPLDKSLTGIPTLFTWSLAYGRNLLRPERETPQWRIRNLVAWARPNPPVGALADKFRPATSYLTVATMARDRWFDMDAVRKPVTDAEWVKAGQSSGESYRSAEEGGYEHRRDRQPNPAGAPLLDYWEIPTQPYKGSHYATFPEELPRRVILSMCPERVCRTCGEPSRRIMEKSEEYAAKGRNWADASDGRGKAGQRERNNHSGQPPGGHIQNAEYLTTGWTDCGHNDYRAGVVLDPFAGSGTTMRMALGNGRSSIGIDLDERNAQLATDRIGPLYLDVETL